MIQKRSRFHNHAGLAETALRHVFLYPCGLTRVLAGGRETFNRREAFIGC